nr:NADH dehydrogenase subunit 3 [Hirudo nipponia]
MLLYSLVLFICFIVPVLLFLVSYMLYFKHKVSFQKLSPFECGFDNLSSSRIPFSTRFFLLGIIFIIFDIEVVLLLPVPLVKLIDGSIIIFLMIMVILFIGLIHEWIEGSLDWMS